MARGRKRMMAGWGLVGAATLSLVLFVVSVFRLVDVSGPRGWGFSLLRGGLIVHHAEFVSSSGWRWISMNVVGLHWWVDSQGHDFSLGVVGVSGRRDASGAVVDVEIALWAPTLTGFVGAGSLLYWGRRAASRSRTDRCPTCGYDLAGLGPGKSCPECGKLG